MQNRRSSGGGPVFGGLPAQDEESFDAATAQSENDPGYGADPTFQAPATDPTVAPRSPGMGLLQPGTGTDIPDSDLLTPEEAGEGEPADPMAALLALAGIDPGILENHDDNLADRIDPNALATLGQEICDMVDADLTSREPWERRFKTGLQLFGLEDFAWENGEAPFEGASTAIHPMLSEAATQSQARLMEEVWPAQGPAKAMVMGVETPEKRDAADRVENHMNYQLTVEDRVYMMESEKLGLYLPMFGSGYRKAYHDYVEDKNVLRFVSAKDLILPYLARNLSSSPRRTHRFTISKTEFIRGVAAGAYRDVDLPDPPQVEKSQEKQELDRVDGKQDVTYQDDIEYEFYETDLWRDMPGFEDDSGPLPWKVTVDSNSQEVVAVRRCWDENDDLKAMSEQYAEYWYLPGLGVYGFGLIHWLGTIAESGTDALRSLFDSATWATMQGGFKAKDANVKAGELQMSPATWVDVDMAADDLQKAFYTPPFKEPSPSLFKLLEWLTTQAQRFAATTDMMVGDQDAKGAPVGTTVALIEQGSKVYSGIHKRAHFACGCELRMLFRLNARFIPEDGYPYQVPGDDMAVYRSDYDTSIVSIVPVSDPNIFSQTQRIALFQAEYQLAKDNPQYFRMGNLIKKGLKAFKEPDIDSIFIDPDDVPDMDPISENIAMVTGRPVKAKDDEDHALHLANHMAFAQHPGFGGLPQAQKMFGAAMMAHIGEHVALLYAQTMRNLGVPVPPINLSAPPGDPITGEASQQPGLNLQIAQAGAAMTGQFMQSSGLIGAPQDEPGQQASEDAHHESQVSQLVGITTALANLAKTGQTIQQAMAVEQAVENGGAPPGAPGPGGLPQPGGVPPPPGGGGALGGAPGPQAPAPARPQLSVVPKAPALAG